MPYNPNYKRTYPKRNYRKRNNNYVTRAELNRRSKVAFYKEHPINVYNYEFDIASGGTPLTSNGYHFDLTYELLQNVLNSQDLNSRVLSGNQTCKIFIDHLFLKLTFRQADIYIHETNDLYGYIRMMIYDAPFQSTALPTDLITEGIFNPAVRENYNRLFMDKTMYLKRSSQILSDTGTIAAGLPSSRNITMNLPIKKSYLYNGTDDENFFSNTANDSLRVFIRSDSAPDESPLEHPNVTGFIGVSYRVLG